MYVKLTVRTRNTSVFFVIIGHISDLSIVDVEQANVCLDKGSRTATLNFASVFFFLLIWVGIYKICGKSSKLISVILDVVEELDRMYCVVAAMTSLLFTALVVVAYFMLKRFK